MEKTMKSRKVIEITIDKMKTNYRLELYHRYGESEHGHSDKLIKSIKCPPYEVLKVIENLFDLK